MGLSVVGTAATVARTAATARMRGESMVTCVRGGAGVWTAAGAGGEGYIEGGHA